VFCDGSVGLSKNWVPKIDEFPAFFPFFPNIDGHGEKPKSTSVGQRPKGLTWFNYQKL